ncbi:MAG: hypothetical protein AAF310_01900 [Myxococcota bacterium]
MRQLKRIWVGWTCCMCVAALWGCGDSNNEVSDSNLAVKGDTVKKIEVGKDLIVVLYDNGAVEKTSIDFEFSPIPSGTYKDVAISNEHVCLIDTKSKLKCHKITTTLRAFKERKPPIDDVKYVAVWAGDSHFCALKEDEEQLVCWGSQCSNESDTCWEATNSNVPDSVQNGATNKNFARSITIDTGINAFASNGKTSCYINASGKLGCFGQDGNVGILEGSGQFSTGAGQVGVAKNFACIVSSNNRVRCWGSTARAQSNNTNCSLGLGCTFAAVPSGSRSKIWAGAGLICAKSSGDDVACTAPDLTTSPATAAQPGLKFAEGQKDEFGGITTFGMPHSSLHNNFCVENGSGDVQCFISGTSIPWSKLKGKDIRKGIK